jgi:hypothetical protein
MAGPNRSPLIFLESTDCQISKNVVSLSAGPPMITGFSPAYPEQVLQAAPHSGMPRATVDLSKGTEKSHLASTLQNET